MPWTVQTNVTGDFRVVASGEKTDAKAAFRKLCDEMAGGATVILADDQDRVVKSANAAAMLAQRKRGRKITVTEDDRKRRSRDLARARTFRWKAKPPMEATDQ